MMKEPTSHVGSFIITRSTNIGDMKIKNWKKIAKEPKPKPQLKIATIIFLKNKNIFFF